MNQLSKERVKALVLTKLNYLAYRIISFWKGRPSSSNSRVRGLTFMSKLVVADEQGRSFSRESCKRKIFAEFFKTGERKETKKTQREGESTGKGVHEGREHGNEAHGGRGGTGSLNTERGIVSLDLHTTITSVLPINGAAAGIISKSDYYLSLKICFAWSSAFRHSWVAGRFFSFEYE
jgi:hypothetical protein